MIARLLVAACLLMAAACAAPSPGSLLGTGSGAHGPVDDLLDRRSQALRAGNEKQFLADLDQRQPALLEHERMVYANLRQLRFTTFRYHQFFPPDIAKPIDLQDGKPVSVLVVLTVRLAGIDTGDSQEGFDYTIVPRNGRPVVTKVEINSLGGGRFNVPWELLPLHMARSGNVTVAADGTVADPASLASAIDAADQQVRMAWGGRPGAPGTLVFASTDQQLTRSWFPAPLSTAVESVAFVSPIPGVDSRGQRTDANVGGRMVLTVGRTPADQLAIIYRHELTHAISSPLIHSTQNPPLWAIEGFAAWMEDPSGRGRVDTVRRAVKQRTFTGQLPDNAVFYDRQGISLNYALGYTVFSFVAGRWGPARASDLYVEAVSGHSLGEATTRALALDEGTFVQQWAAYARLL